MAPKSSVPGKLVLRKLGAGLIPAGQSTGGRPRSWPLAAIPLGYPSEGLARRSPGGQPRRAWFLALGLVLVLNLTFGLSGAWAAGPMEDIQSLIEEVQAVLQTMPEKHRRLELVEQATTRHLDFREMAKRSLGTTWASLNRSQQDEFVELFSALLKISYASHLDEFAKTQVAYQGETQQSEGCEVRILVIRPNDKIPVNFRLLHEPQGWMIYDMVIEGVSLVDNFHNQFAAMIKECSFGELVRCLRERLAAEPQG
jgi:phospholipid transport system substrate-binding protein